MQYLNTIKRYSGRIFIKFERDEGSFEILLDVCSIRVFANFGNSYYEPLAYATHYDHKRKLCHQFIMVSKNYDHIREPSNLCYLFIVAWTILRT